jgi:acyl-CoA thioester hydrolase
VTAAGTPARISVQRRVEWADTDAAGHQHFTAVLRWVEQAETLLCERLGIADRTLGHMPRVRVESDFSQRLFPGEVVDVDLEVTRVGRSSVAFAFVVRRDGEDAARGTVVAAFVDAHTGATPWPDDIRHALTTGGRLAGERYTVVAPT